MDARELADTIHHLRSNERGWSPRACGNFRAVEGVLLLVLDEKPCGRVCEAVPAQFGFQEGGESPASPWRGGRCTVLARPGEVSNFFHRLGESGALAKSGRGKGKCCKSFVEMIPNGNNFVWLQRVQPCTAATTVKHPVTWCKDTGAAGRMGQQCYIACQE